MNIPEPSPQQRRKEEFRSWVFLAVVMAPVLAVLTVSGYGFIVWMWQTFVGGPPQY
jgi:nitrate reductase NapE